MVRQEAPVVGSYSGDSRSLYRDGDTLHPGLRADGYPGDNHPTHADDPDACSECGYFALDGKPHNCQKRSGPGFHFRLSQEYADSLKLHPGPTINNYRK